jgi:hypothetical protein
MICGFSRGRNWLVAATAAAVLVVGAGAQGQVCTLPMDVPATSDIDATLESNVRGLGLRLTWPSPEDAVSTCYALLDTAALGIDIAVTGDYRDAYDRMLSFACVDSGQVGSGVRNRVVVTWENVNRSRTGSIGGEINLSNTGGLWRYSFDSGAWAQLNDGLPRFLAYFDIDAFARGANSRLLAVSSGNQPGIAGTARGVHRAVGDGPWQEVGAEIFGRNLIVAKVAIDPDDDNRFAVGTKQNGVYVTSDGGQTFTRWAPVANPNVSAVVWTSTRLYAAIVGSGLYSSADGLTWTEYPSLRVPSNLDVAQPVPTVPQVAWILEEPTDANHIYVVLKDHLLYHSTDAGATWTSLGGDLVVANPNQPGAWKYSGQSLHVDGDLLVVGTLRQGIWRSEDHGQHWARADAPSNGLPVQPTYVDIIAANGGLVAQGDQYGLVSSDDDGATWELFGNQLANRNGLQMVRDADGSLLLPTWGGGIYVAGTPISISETIQSGVTDPAYRSLDFGLDIAFGPGMVYGRSASGDYPGQSFRLNAQDFQGWIVWRGDRDLPDEMTMIGRYDKNNPESCIEGFCGDDSYVVIPNCFSERRANCFDFSVPGLISFFDGDVYNGFEYYYAVTPYDYGDVSTVTDPVSLAAPLVHPDRYPGDPAGVGDGQGNRFNFEVNEAAQPAVDGQEIYVYPNPLRRDTGIVGGEGEEVRWANLPPNSRIEIFTLAGDKLAELSGADQHEGNMYWTARNDDGALLASGIYIWRCIMPERNDFWGKLIIIR